MIPPELAQVAEASQEAEDNIVAQSAPQGVYPARELNMVVESLNQVLPLFSLPAYATFAEDATTMPVDFVKQLTMVLDAGREAGIIDPVDLTSIKNAKGLMLLSAKLDTLAKSKEFARYLKEEAKEESPAPKPAAPEAMPKEMDIESLMAARA